MFSIDEIKLQPLFTLYLILAAGFVGELFGCRIRQYLINHMLIKHLIGFLTLHFFVTLANQQTSDDLNEETFKNNLLNSVFIYGLFVISTRVKYHFFWLFITALLVLYTIELHNNKRTEIVNKSTQSDNHKKQELYKIDYLNKIKKYLMYFIVFILVVGFLVYLGEKRIEYGDNFSFYTFIVGNPVCRGKEVSENLLEDLKYGLGLDKLTGSQKGGGDIPTTTSNINNMLDEL